MCNKFWGHRKGATQACCEECPRENKRRPAAGKTGKENKVRGGNRKLLFGKYVRRRYLAS